jgi:hypothetical protein
MSSARSGAIHDSEGPPPGRAPGLDHVALPARRALTLVPKPALSGPAWGDASSSGTCMGASCDRSLGHCQWAAVWRGGVPPACECGRDEHRSSLTV